MKPRKTTSLFPVPSPPKARKPTLYFERLVRKDGFCHIAGVDEVGRGCLAGPVVAAAVILDPDVQIRGLNDSKLLPETKRNVLDRRIRERALAVSIGVCSPTEIDTLNILWASLDAMRKAVEGLPQTPDYLLIDGNRTIPGSRYPSRSIIKGDLRSRSIAAASIVAKTYRDKLMRSLHDKYPVYGWNTNVGYPTQAHYDGLAIHGPCELHRQSFRLTGTFLGDAVDSIEAQELFD